MKIKYITDHFFLIIYIMDLAPDLTLTNKSPFRKTFTYFLNPQYSFKTKKPIGSINLELRDVISKTMDFKL